MMGCPTVPPSCIVDCPPLRHGGVPPLHILTGWGFTLVGVCVCVLGGGGLAWVCP